jgi:hypothetical protein
LQHVGRNCCHFFPDVLFQVYRCPWFLFVHLALEISSEEKVLRPGTLVPVNVEVPTKHPLSQDIIVVFENCLRSETPMLYRPALHGNWNALSLARRTLKDKFPTPAVPLTTVLQNRQVFLPDPVDACVACKRTTLPLSSVTTDTWYGTSLFTTYQWPSSHCIMKSWHFVRSFPDYSEKQEKVTSARQLKMARRITSIVPINYTLSDK